MHVLIADAFEQSGLDALADAGCTVSYQPDLKAQALCDAVALTRADVLVVRSTPVTADMLDAGVLSLVVRAGAGYNTIDVTAASQRGIYVSNCPGKNAVAVAELALGLMLALDRHMAEGVADLRAGQWNKKAFSQAHGLLGSTLGLIGYGNIGQEVAKRALAFGIHVLVWSRRFQSGDEQTDLPVSIARSPEDLARRSDIVSLHLALNKETRGFIGEAFLSSMKSGAMFINTARAELVDYTALERAIRERGLRAGLDVFPDEPTAGSAAFASSIASLPGVYGTHHIGASTEQAQEAIAAETVRIITGFMRTGSVPNVVNLARTTPATHTLVVRHRDRPGVLAFTFDQLRSAGINVQETSNIIFEGAEAAVARINVDREPDSDTLKTLRTGHADVIDVRVFAV